MGLFNRQKLNRSKVQSYVPPANVGAICPHCNTTINGLFTQDIKMPFGKAYVYFCTNCSKVLGVSQRKGFWMG